nr:hypothetical protein GCM10020093_074310 [Planobispora longispora]
MGPLRAGPGARRRLQHRGRLPVPGELLPAAGIVRRGLPGHPARDQAAGGAGPAGDGGAVRPPAARARPRDRAHRLGQDLHAGGLVDLANRTRSGHIVTIEDPIEFLHPHKRCIVNQREVGADTTSFAQALKHALRQDPDIILVGELRDLETTATALAAAETGHLVLATLHTQSAAQTIDRVIDIFPPHQQQQIRTQLSTALQGVVTQALAPRADGVGRAVVAEVMIATPAIRNLIREGKNHQIPSFMQSGGSGGMIAFDQHLSDRVRSGLVSFENALDICHSAEEFKRLVGRN